MGRINQNDIEHLGDLLERGIITADEANVEMVRMQRFRVISAPLSRQTRTALNKAVKDGLLCHKKRNGNRPEVYYHPEFEHLADAEVAGIADDAIRAIMEFFGKESDSE